MITDREAFSSLRFGFELGYALETLYPGKIPWETNRFLIGNKRAVEAGKAALDPKSAWDGDQGVPDFLARRASYLIYK